MPDDSRTYIKIEPGYFADSKSGIIYYIRSHGGEVVKFSCKTKNLVTAKRYAFKEVKRRQGQKKMRLTRDLIKDEIDSYVALREADYLSGEDSRRTFLCVRSSLKKAEPFWQDRLPTDIDRDSWAEFCAWFMQEYPGQQMFNVTKYMRALTKYMAEKGVIAYPPKLNDPTAKKSRIKRQKKRERIFTDSDVRKILSVCSEDEQLIMLLMYTMAFRISEACGLRWEYLDLDPKDPVYKFKEDNNKAGHFGYQSIHPEVFKRLIDKDPKKSGPVFPQVRNSKQPIKSQQIDWKRLYKEADLGFYWTSHTFRHTCLTKLFSDPDNPHTLIMKCFRVSLGVALEHYIHVTEDGRKRMASAIEVKL